MLSAGTRVLTARHGVPVDLKGASQRQRHTAGVLQAANVTQKLKGRPPAKPKGTQRLQPNKSGTQKSGTQKKSQSPGLGTLVKRKARQITEIAQVKGSPFQTRQEAKSAPLLLARVQQLRLLSKLEQAGLLSLLERSGITLSFIERSGLLSKAESLGLLSAAADRNTPRVLFRLALALYAAGPLLVYAVPDNSTPLIAVQGVAALACLLGGTAAFGGASLLNTIQTEQVV